MPDLLPTLPPGYRGRPITADDIGTVHRLVAACERELYGRVRTDPGGIAADLARPGLDPASDTLLIHDATGRPAARAWVDRRCEVDVHPDHRGRGLGAALLDWAEARACRAGSERITQTVPDGDSAAVALLLSRGYEPKATEWLLAFPMPDEPTVPEPPAGITVRPYRPGDGHAAHRLVEDGFAAWQERRMSYREWSRHTVRRPGFAPAMSMLALAGDHPVGAVLALDDPDHDDGWIEQVAVRHDHRNRGVARLLLRHSFRAFHRQGRRTVALGTHSLTGALALYLHVGMEVRHSATVRTKRLRPA